MSRATPKMRDLSQHLIAYETNGNKRPETNIPVAFHVGEKLRPHLASLMGNVGFSALLSRALALANAEVPWLHVVQVRADGSLAQIDEPAAQVDQKEIFEGSVVLLAQLLGLLVVFIGENLTLRLLHDIWPKLSLKDFNLDKGET